jgi:hypothetical protein
VFSEYHRERFIRRTLCQLARQRVATVLKPGNVWLIENAVEDDEHTDAALKTCYMRGWIEPLTNDAIPKGQLSPDGHIPAGGPFQGKAGVIYRLTDAGWSVIHRAQLWTLVSVGLGVIAALVGIIAILVPK